MLPASVPQPTGPCPCCLPFFSVTGQTSGPQGLCTSLLQPAELLPHTFAGRLLYIPDPSTCSGHSPALVPPQPLAAAKNIKFTSILCPPPL